MEINKEYLSNKAFIEAKSKELVKEGTRFRRRLEDMLNETIEDEEVKVVWSNLGRLVNQVENWDMVNDKSEQAAELDELINKVENWLQDRPAKAA